MVIIQNKNKLDYTLQYCYEIFGMQTVYQLPYYCDSFSFQLTTMRRLMRN